MGEVLGNGITGFYNGYDIGELVLGANYQDLLLVKIGLWIILLAVLYNLALKKIFKENLGAGFIVALVISWLGMVFLPESFVVKLGEFTTLIVVGAIFALLYLGFKRLFPRLSGKAFWFVMSVFFFVMYYLISTLGRQFTGNEIIDSIILFLTDYNWMLLVAGIICFIIFLYLVWKSRKKQPYVLPEKEGKKKKEGKPKVIEKEVIKEKYKQKKRDRMELQQKYNYYLFGIHKKGLKNHQRKRMLDAMNAIQSLAKKNKIKLKGKDPATIESNLKAKGEL
ncbi:hypothetical protein K8R47_03255 [archaeon]|nr:hypothetical protein [archaeon]